MSFHLSQFNTTNQTTQKKILTHLFNMQLTFRTFILLFAANLKYQPELCKLGVNPETHATHPLDQGLLTSHSHSLVYVILGALKDRSMVQLDAPHPGGVEVSMTVSTGNSIVYSRNILLLGLSLQSRQLALNNRIHNLLRFCVAGAEVQHWSSGGVHVWKFHADFEQMQTTAIRGVLVFELWDQSSGKLFGRAKTTLGRLVQTNRRSTKPSTRDR
jgi:hypothetical protein